MTNSRHNKRVNEVWRRRHCLKCQAIFTTYEAADLTNSMVVQYTKKDLRRFIRELLFVSVYESCKHREDAAEAAKSLTATIVALIIQLAQSETGRIERDTIVAISQEVISRFDAVAGSVYGAYHQSPVSR